MLPKTDTEKEGEADAAAGLNPASSIPGETDHDLGAVGTSLNVSISSTMSSASSDFFPSPTSDTHMDSPTSEAQSGSYNDPPEGASSMPNATSAPGQDYEAAKTLLNTSISSTSSSASSDSSPYPINSSPSAMPDAQMDSATPEAQSDSASNPSKEPPSASNTSSSLPAGLPTNGPSSASNTSPSSSAGLPGTASAQGPLFDPPIEVAVSATYPLSASVSGASAQLVPRTAVMEALQRYSHARPQGNQQRARLPNPAYQPQGMVRLPSGSLVHRLPFVARSTVQPIRPPTLSEYNLPQGMVRLPSGLLAARLPSTGSPIVQVLRPPVSSEANQPQGMIRLPSSLVPSVPFAGVHSALPLRPQASSEASAQNLSQMKKKIMFLRSQADWDPLDPKREEGEEGERLPASTIQRVQRDLQSIYTEPLPGIFVAQDGDNIDRVHCFMLGPNDTPYEGGLFHFYLKFGKSYPFRPPLVRFLTTGYGMTRFNPNLYENGKVCLSLLGTWDGPAWSPVQNLSSLLLSIQSLLCEKPYHNEPGFSREKKVGDAQVYNKVIIHETIRVAVLGNFETKIRSFYDEADELFPTKGYYARSTNVASTFVTQYEFPRNVQHLHEILASDNVKNMESIQNLSLAYFHQYYDHFITVCRQNITLDGTAMIDPTCQRVRGVFRFQKLKKCLEALREIFDKE